MKLYKFHGAGNDFLIADARRDTVNLSQEEIVHLCDRHTGFGSDGLMVIGNSNDTAFKMKFYNPDGTSGMMCGNGGRCISAYAAMTSARELDRGRPRDRRAGRLHPCGAPEDERREGI